VKAFKNFFKPVDETLDYDPEELALGIKVELEHTPYKSIARIIAKQHLAENERYYSDLKKVEGSH